jgi:hypothetical protein
MLVMLILSLCELGEWNEKVKENRVKRDKVCHRIMNEWEASAYFAKGQKGFLTVFFYFFYFAKATSSLMFP